LVCLAACGGDDKQRRDLANDGEVCLRLLPSGAVEVEVTFRGCLTSCDVAKPASCAVTQEDGSGEEAGLRVFSQGAVETTGASVCSSACGKLRTSCTSTDTLAPGRYSVHHGDQTAGLVLGTRSQCLFTE
jgi:hypothetical protein